MIMPSPCGIPHFHYAVAAGTDPSPLSPSLLNISGMRRMPDTPLPGTGHYCRSSDPILFGGIPDTVRNAAKHRPLPISHSHKMQRPSVRKTDGNFFRPFPSSRSFGGRVANFTFSLPQGAVRGMAGEILSGKHPEQRNLKNHKVPRQQKSGAEKGEMI